MRLRLFARAQAATSGADVSFSIWEGAMASPRSVWNTPPPWQSAILLRLRKRRDKQRTRAPGYQGAEAT